MYSDQSTDRRHITKPKRKIMSEGINMYIKCESPSSHDSEFLAKVKVFKKLVKGQGQGYRVKHFGSNGKGLVCGDISHIIYI